MKKYLQISLVLGAFAVLVWYRSSKGEDNQAPVNPPKYQDTNSITNIPSTSNERPSNVTGRTYKDGRYTGSVADAFYGNLQIEAVINGGKISDIIFLQYPNDNHTSQSINDQASVYLKQEAIAAQNANVDIVSGASDSSNAFRQSLASALSQAQQ